MKRSILAVLLACLIAVAICACGGSTSSSISTTTPSPAPQSALCPAGTGFMGCSLSKTGPTFGPRIAPPAGPKFPDVSSFQGHPDWAAAKSQSHIAGAVIKAGEFTHEDPDAAWNAAQLKRLGIPFAVYWFDRPISCGSEGAAIEQVAKSLGARLVIIDQEVSGIQGHYACLSPFVRAVTGQGPLVYRSASNDFDTSANNAPCWVAAYGPASAPACNGRPIAWQFTDGTFGPVVSIAGIGRDDVNVDMGLLARIAPPGPKVLGGKQHYERYPEAPARPHRERPSVQGWDSQHCTNPVRRQACRVTRSHLAYDLGRDQALYRRDSKTLRDQLFLPGRIQGLSHRLNDGRGVVHAWL